MSNLRLLDTRLMDPVFGDPLESMFRRFMEPLRADMESRAIDMRLDVAEVDGKYMVHADLPGVQKDDIHVRIDGNLVQIEAEAKSQKDVKKDGGKVLRSERWHGAVSRSFTVAQDVDEKGAIAKFENGVLTLELPKKAPTASKQLAIQ